MALLQLSFCCLCPLNNFWGFCCLCPLNNFWRDALISFKPCTTLYYCKIQVRFDIDKHLPNFGWVRALFWLSFCWCVDTGFRSVAFAGMHWFYWKFAERYIIAKYRFDINNHPQNFGPVMVLFRLSFCWCGYIGFNNNFCRDALILLKVCRRIYHCTFVYKIQVMFIGNRLQNFGPF